MRERTPLVHILPLIVLVLAGEVHAQFNPEQIVAFPPSPVASDAYLTVVVPARGCLIYGAYDNKAALLGPPTVTITHATETSAGVIDISVQEADLPCDIAGKSESAMFPVAVAVQRSHPRGQLPAGEYTINYTTHALKLDISVFDRATGYGPPLPGLWAIDSEVNGSPGRGFQLELQGNTMVLTFYGYDASGAGRFWLASGPYANHQFSSMLSTYDGGRRFGGPAQSAHSAGAAGTVTVVFTSPTSGTITLPDEPAKSISYFPF